MDSIDDAIDLARKMGRIAADQSQAKHGGAAVIGRADTHYPREVAGVLVLQAYQEDGPEAVRAVVEGYQDAYNARAEELGTERLTLDQITNRIHWALPKRTTDDEGEAILSPDVVSGQRPPPKKSESAMLSGFFLHAPKGIVTSVGCRGCPLRPASGVLAFLLVLR